VNGERTRLACRRSVSLSRTLFLAENFPHSGFRNPQSEDNQWPAIEKGLVEEAEKKITIEESAKP